MEFCMKQKKTLNSLKKFKIKNKNTKPIAVDVLFYAYPILQLSCRSNLITNRFNVFSHCPIGIECEKT